MPEKHPARHGKRRARRGGPALEPEAGQVAVLAKVVRGHEKHAPRPVARRERLRRGALVGGEIVQREVLQEHATRLAGFAVHRFLYWRVIFMPASATDPRQSMLPTQKPKKVWQAGAAPAVADWEEELDRELKFFTDGMEDLQGSGGGGGGLDKDDVQGLQGSLGPLAVFDKQLIIPTEIADFDAQQVKGIPNSRSNAPNLDKMAIAAENLRNQTKTELIELLKSAKNPDVSETNLTNDMIIQGMTSSAVRPSELRQEIQAKAYEYQTNVFYSVVFVTLKNLKDKLQSIYTGYYNPDDRKSNKSMTYRNCLAKYYEFQNYFNKINSGLIAKLDAKNYEAFCKYLDIGSEIQKLQKEFDAVVDKVPPIPPEEEAGAAGPGPSAASESAPAQPASTGATQPPQPPQDPPGPAGGSAPPPQPPPDSAGPAGGSAPPPQPSDSSGPAGGSSQSQPAPPKPSAQPPPAPQDPSAEAPAPQTAQPTVPQDPMPPSGANKRGTKDKYFAYNFDFLPDLQLYLIFDKNEEINPGSPAAISHATQWSTYYTDSFLKFRLDLDNYVLHGSADKDFEEKKKVLEGNLWICKVFEDIWAIILRTEEEIKPFYDKARSKKFDDSSPEYRDYDKLFSASQDVLKFFLEIESKLSIDLASKNPQLAQSNLFDAPTKKKMVDFYQKFLKELESFFPSKSNAQSKQQPNTSRSQSQSGDSQSQSASSETRDNSSRREPKTRFSSRKGSMSNDVRVLQEQLRQTIEWGLEMRAAAQENYRIAQKVREFFGPGYEFGEPNKKEPGYDDPPFD